MDYQATISFLREKEQRDLKYDIEHKYDLERITFLCQALNHPERRFPIIHVAGTNGKGSVCAMLERIYRGAGFTTGLYTSPHLVSCEERIQVNRNMLPQEDIVRYTAKLLEIATPLLRMNPKNDPSFFELITAMAFLHFAENKVDLAIIETGLGGRLDATNVVDPLVSVITSISLDHLEFLGDTISAIASEKAGIIKRGKPVVIGPLCSEAETVIQRVAKVRNAPIFKVEDRFGSDIEAYPKTNLSGRSQHCNAATATLTVDALQDPFPIPQNRVAQALLNVDWPAHWQSFDLSQGKQIILDSTHNSGGAHSLEENLQKLIAQSRRKPIIIIGTVGESRAQALMPVAARYARELILVKPNRSSATDFDLLKKAIPKNFKGRVIQSSIEGLFPKPYFCTLGEVNDTVVATGSIYLIGEIMQRLFHSKLCTCSRNRSSSLLKAITL